VDEQDGRAPLVLTQPRGLVHIGEQARLPAAAPSVKRWG
jgi:hypothetical protein